MTYVVRDMTSKPPKIAIWVGAEYPPFVRYHKACYGIKYKWWIAAIFAGILSWVLIFSIGVLLW